MTRTWNPIRLRKVIEDRGYTRRHIAKHVLLSEETLTKILNGRKPGDQTLALLAMLLKTNVDFLTGKSDNPAPNKEQVA